MARREFHFTEGTSNKFWTIELSGKSFTVRFGRIGTDGQTQTKEFAGADEAKKAYDKLVAEKIKKGYQEVGAPSAGETTAPAEKPAKGKRAGKEKAPAEPRAKQEEPPEATVLTSAAAVSTDVVRRLHLSPAEVAMKSGEAIQRPAPNRLIVKPVCNASDALPNGETIIRTIILVGNGARPRCRNP